jgi:hypothetical protein
MQLSEKGILFPKNGMLLPNSGKNLSSNKNFNPDKYKIIPYLTKGLIYNALTSFITSGNNIISILSVFNTESIVNQTSIYKVIRIPK